MPCVSPPALSADDAGATPQTLGLERAKYNPDAIQGFYRFIWSLFYSEYVLFLFICTFAHVPTGNCAAAC